jgi:hypothetical protein
MALMSMSFGAGIALALLGRLGNETGHSLGPAVVIQRDEDDVGGVGMPSLAAAHSLGIDLHRDVHG